MFAEGRRVRMWGFWLRVAKRFPKVIWESCHHAEGIVGVLLFIVSLFNSTVGNTLTAWIGVHPAALWTIVVAILLHLMMRAIYLEFEDVFSSPCNRSHVGEE